MKSMKVIAAGAMAALMLVSSSCSSWTNTGKGAAIGGGGGAALGAGLGALIGGGKGAGIGAAIGAAVGTGAGVLIGQKMDKQKKELEAQLANANVETVTDRNGLEAIKVTFPGGILFPTGKWNINANAQTELKQFAASLVQNPMTNVQIYGFTDDTGSMQANQKVSTNRANAVEQFLENNGVAANRIVAEGLPMQDYVASNATPEGRAQNRRVEIYISASDQMIQQANDGTLK